MGNKIASQYKYKTLYHKYDTIYAINVLIYVKPQRIDRKSSVLKISIMNHS
jgi:hypothetical protein